MLISFEPFFARLHPFLLLFRSLTCLSINPLAPPTSPIFSTITTSTFGTKSLLPNKRTHSPIPLFATRRSEKKPAVRLIGVKREGERKIAL